MLKTMRIPYEMKLQASGRARRKIIGPAIFARLAALLILICLSGMRSPAWAQEGKETFDPFSQLSQKNWVTPDKFEKTDLLPPENAHGKSVPSAQSQTSPSANPKSPNNAEAENAGKAPHALQRQDQEADRQEFGLEVDSTAENMSLPIPLPPENADKRQIRHYEPGWMEAAAAARRQSFIESPKGWQPYGGNSAKSLRLSFLPGKVPSLTQQQAPTSPSPDATAKAEAAQKKAAQTPKNKTDSVAPDIETWTKAIKDYKTKQMEAIQSDRQTLEALQNAIKELGLQKELNFDSSLLLSPTKQEAPSSGTKDSAQHKQ